MTKVKAAVLGHGAAGPGLDGWKAVDGGAVSRAGRPHGRAHARPVMAEPEVVRLEDQDVLVPPPLEPALPELRTRLYPCSGRRRRMARLEAGEPLAGRSSATASGCAWSLRGEIDENADFSELRAALPATST